MLVAPSPNNVLIWVAGVTPIPTAPMVKTKTIVLHVPNTSLRVLKAVGPPRNPWWKNFTFLRTVHPAWKAVRRCSRWLRGWLQSRWKWMQQKLKFDFRINVSMVSLKQWISACWGKFVCDSAQTIETLGHSECIDYALHCDGQRHCPGGEDELNCRKQHSDSKDTTYD